jgi:hypothetical protein
MIDMTICMLAMTLWMALQHRRTPEAWGGSGRAAPDHESPCAVACASKVEGFTHSAIRVVVTYSTITLHNCFRAHCYGKTIPSNKAQLLRSLAPLT